MCKKLPLKSQTKERIASTYCTFLRLVADVSEMLDNICMCESRRECDDPPRFALSLPLLQNTI